MNVREAVATLVVGVFIVTAATLVIAWMLWRYVRGDRRTNLLMEGGALMGMFVALGVLDIIVGAEVLP